MTLNIIGAGFGRTGTKSLKTAIDLLGFGPCYHMTEVKNNDGHRYRWNEIAFGAPPDWDALFENYNAAVDWPAAHYWRELAEAYPEAKIILTIRDPEDWFRSFSDTIRPVMNRDVEPGSPEDAFVHRQTIRKMILEDTFQRRDHDRAYAIGAFMQRAEDVARTIPQERLLVYEITQGWGPLCDFLGVPVPMAPFPHKNTTEEFLSQDPRRKREDRPEGDSRGSAR